VFVAYYKPLPFRAFHYSASTPYFSHPQRPSPLRTAPLARHTGLDPVPFSFFINNNHHLYPLPLPSVTPACSFGDLTRSRSLNLTRSAYQINALSLLYVTPASEPVPLPHSKNELLKKSLNQVQGDISGVCRILQTTSISCISLSRINAIFLSPTTLITFTHCPLIPSHRT